MLNLIRMNDALKDIQRKRDEVSTRLIAASNNIKDGNIRTIGTADLKLLFELYDEIFFYNWFKNTYKGKLSFSLSKRMTKSAGKTICPRNIETIKPENLNIEIRISTDFLFQYDTIQEDKRVCGIQTKNSLDALQLVFEHELCHVIEFIIFYNSNCNKERFKTIARNLFGHTQSYHELPTYKQIAKQNYGFNIGDTVLFMLKDKRYNGVLYGINKRATVMVKDLKGSYTDKYGNRYAKYYVPLEYLKKG